MTRDDIIRLAREASSEPDYDFPNISALERFAALVAAAEREQCANLIDQMVSEHIDGRSYITLESMAGVIRARK